MTITSPHNPHLKEIRKLNQGRRVRHKAGRFVAEGEDLLAAAEAAGWPAVERYCAAGTQLPGTEIDPALLADVSELGSSTRTLAVYDIRWGDAPAGPLCVYLDGVADPGNVGTILRAAQAFGASSVALGPHTADPYSPKAVRASMGAIFQTPLTLERDLSRLPGATVALVVDPPDTPQLADLELPDTVTLLIGAEREGLPQQTIAAADLRARIPIRNHSLNAAMAATVAMYEVSRRMARTS